MYSVVSGTVVVVLTSDTIKGLRNKFLKWKEVFENMGLKVDLGKTKLMVSGLSNSMFGPCWVCCSRVKAYSVLCVKCGKRIHGICAGVRRVTPISSLNFVGRKCEDNR